MLYNHSCRDNIYTGIYLLIHLSLYFNIILNVLCNLYQIAQVAPREIFLKFPLNIVSLWVCWKHRKQGLPTSGLPGASPRQSWWFDREQNSFAQTTNVDPAQAELKQTQMLPTLSRKPIARKYEF